MSFLINYNYIFSQHTYPHKYSFLNHIEKKNNNNLILHYYNTVHKLLILDYNVFK